MTAHPSDSSTTDGGPKEFNNQAKQNASRAPIVMTLLIGVYLLLVGCVLVYLLIAIWPALSQGTSTTVEFPGFLRITMDRDTALLVLVVVSSAIGSYVYVATSFAHYVGNRTFATSWIWWYVLRVFIGIALAVIFYLAIRGGLLTAQADASDINLYGIAALTALIGLFSNQATDKLEEVFTALFREEQKDVSSDVLEQVEQTIADRVDQSVHNALVPPPLTNVEGALEAEWRQEKGGLRLDITVRTGPDEWRNALERGARPFRLAGGEADSETMLEVAVDLPGHAVSLGERSIAIATEGGIHSWSGEVEPPVTTPSEAWVALFTHGRFLQAIPAENIGAT